MCRLRVGASRNVPPVKLAHHSVPAPDYATPSHLRRAPWSSTPWSPPRAPRPLPPSPLFTTHVSSLSPFPSPPPSLPLPLSLSLSGGRLGVCLDLSLLTHARVTETETCAEKLEIDTSMAAMALQPLCLCLLRCSACVFTRL
jgi:hypothetical protein